MVISMCIKQYLLDVFNKLPIPNKVLVIYGPKKQKSQKIGKPLIRMLLLMSLLHIIIWNLLHRSAGVSTQAW